MTLTRHVVGVDGCPGGTWVLARGRTDSAAGTNATIERLGVEVVPDLASLIDEVRQGRVAAVAIDLPIGLLDEHPRPADVAARTLLGPRRSSVFPTPVRATLGATSYEDACERSRSSCGKALSKQAYYLLERIQRLDAMIVPSDQDRLVEAHPELAFVRLKGATLETTKHTAWGRDERRRLLLRELPEVEVTRVLRAACAPQADLLDALSLVTTALRIALGVETRLATVLDPTGKRAEIAF